MADLTPITVTITAAGTISTEAKLGFKTLVGILFPANWTPAAVTFQATPDDTNFFPLFDQVSGAAIGITSAALGTWYALTNDAQWATVNGVRLISGIAQTNTVIVTLFVRTVAF
jgi:hypothetical protein